MFNIYNWLQIAVRQFHGNVCKHGKESGENSMITNRTPGKCLIIGWVVAAILIVSPMPLFGETPTIRVNYYNKFLPLSFKRNGQMQGILVDSLDAVLTKRLGMTLTHKGYPWQRAQTLVQDGAADAIITNPTDARKTYAYFTKSPFVTSYVVILTSSANTRKSEIDQIRVIEDLKHFRQVDHRGNGWARKWFKGLDIHWVNSLEQAIRLLDAQRYDIFVGNGLVARAIIREQNLKEKIAVRNVPDIAEPGQFHFGLRKTFPDARKIIDDVETALADAKSDGEIERIVARYLE